MFFIRKVVQPEGSSLGASKVKSDTVISTTGGGGAGSLGASACFAGWQALRVRVIRAAEIVNSRREADIGTPALRKRLNTLYSDDV
jgi:hypothetical protein